MGEMRHGTLGVTEEGTVAPGSSFTYNFSLISAILNQPKYFPLIFTNLGLDIYIYLETAENIGIWSAAPVRVRVAVWTTMFLE